MRPQLKSCGLWMHVDIKKSLRFVNGFWDLKNLLWIHQKLQHKVLNGLENINFLKLMFLTAVAMSVHCEV